MIFTVDSKLLSIVGTDYKSAIGTGAIANGRSKFTIVNQKSAIQFVYFSRSDQAGNVIKLRDF